MFKDIFPENFNKCSYLHRTYSNSTLKKNNKKIDDEWYTTRPVVDSMLLSHLDYLKDKKIYLPCDSEESEFVRFMKDHNLNYKNTSDDYMKHDDLWEWADIIITNPPFSKATQWHKRILQFKKECWFIHNLWIPLTILSNRPLQTLIPHLTYSISSMEQIVRNYYPSFKRYQSYKRPDGSLDGIGCRFYRLDFTANYTNDIRHRKINWLTFERID